MVKITNGVNTFEVPSGSLGIYANQGYRPAGKVAKKAEPKKEEPTGNTGNEDDDLDFLEEIQEKPLQNWSQDEAKRYAALNDIDLKGTKSLKEAKGVIKQFMDEQQRQANA